MTESPENMSIPAASDAATSPVRPEELPPVEPPSAGFIVQLFLIPALIVAAVIGVWLLFGKLAHEETNWQQLVVELGSSNEHRRWRAALGLAQVLRNQEIAPNENGDRLAEQPQVAEALTSLLKESLSSNSTLDDDIKHQEFLTRTLGALDADDLVLPVLAKAMSADRNQEVRKSGLMSLAMISGRHFESVGRSMAADTDDDSPETLTLAEPLAEPTISDKDVLAELKKAAQDEDPGIRHLAAYCLALVSGPDSISQLKVMLLDGDAMARANAAVGLSRNGSVAGVDALIKLIEDGAQEPNREAFQKLTQQDQQLELRKRQFEQPIILSNCLRALESVLDSCSEQQKETLKTALNKLAETPLSADVKLKVSALQDRI